jgi:hypothetical protein
VPRRPRRVLRRRFALRSDRPHPRAAVLAADSTQPGPQPLVPQQQQLLPQAAPQHRNIHPFCTTVNDCLPTRWAPFLTIPYTPSGAICLEKLGEERGKVLSTRAHAVFAYGTEFRHNLCAQWNAPERRGELRYRAKKMFARLARERKLEKRKWQAMVLPATNVLLFFHAELYIERIGTNKACAGPFPSRLTEPTLTRSL